MCTYATSEHRNKFWVCVILGLLLTVHKVWMGRQSICIGQVRTYTQISDSHVVQETLLASLLLALKWQANISSTRVFPLWSSPCKWGWQATPLLNLHYLFMWWHTKIITSIYQIYATCTVFKCKRLQRALKKVVCMVIILNSQTHLLKKWGQVIPSRTGVKVTKGPSCAAERGK